MSRGADAVEPTAGRLDPLPAAESPAEGPPA
jgi:hypothetical protein